MKLLLYILLVFIVVLVYKLFKSFEKNIIFTVICSLVILQIVLSPKLCMDAALLGLNLFITKVFPSLFPFLVATGIMISYDGVKIYSKILGKLLCKPLRLPIQCTFALVVSILCGYPLGAKYSCDLYEQREIDLNTCQRLINIASNTSPLFAIGSVGTAMLKSTYMGYMLLLSNYISCFVMGLILPSHSKSIKILKSDIPAKVNMNIGNVIKDSIESAVKTCLSIGGFVILFSVITNIIKSNILFDIAVNKMNTVFLIDKSLIEGILLGAIEMTNGCYIISTLSADMYLKAIIISFFLGFSGLSIISQVYSFTYKYDLSMRKYIVIKVLQGFICSIITAILLKVPLFSESVQNIRYHTSSNLSVVFVFLTLLIFIPFIIYHARRLSHSS